MQLKVRRSQKSEMLGGEIISVPEVLAEPATKEQVRVKSY